MGYDPWSCIRLFFCKKRARLSKPGAVMLSRQSQYIIKWRRWDVEWLTECVNDPKTIRANADFILSYYRRLSRLTGGFEDGDTLMAMEITEGSYSTVMPSVPLRTRDEYRAEKRAMILAWQQLNKKHRQILYLSYMDQEQPSMNEIAFRLDRLPRSMSARKTIALLAFAEIYKGGVLKIIE